MMRIHRRNNCSVSLEGPSKHGTCAPGGFKLFVAANGYFSICEKLEGFENLTIGDVNRGVDLGAVERMLTDFYELNWQKCSHCWMARFCPCCYLHPWSGKHFDSQKLNSMCDIWQHHYDRMFSVYCTIMEANPSAFVYLDQQV